jgi:hypothetical protein
MVYTRGILGYIVSSSGKLSGIKKGPDKWSVSTTNGYDIIRVID